jgi:hypothetical protein
MNWTDELTELNNFFDSVELPETIELNGWEKIIDPKKFVTNHLSLCWYNNGDSSALPYLDRLREVKKLLSK